MDRRTRRASSPGQEIKHSALAKLRDTLAVTDLGFWFAELIIKAHEQQQPTKFRTSACKVSSVVFDYDPESSGPGQDVQRGKIGTQAEFNFEGLNAATPIYLDEDEIWSVELVVWMCHTDSLSDARAHRMFNVPLSNAFLTPGFYSDSVSSVFVQADNPEMKAHCVFHRSVKQPSESSRLALAHVSFALTADMERKLLRLEEDHVDCRAHEACSHFPCDADALRGAYQPAPPLDV